MAVLKPCPQCKKLIPQGLQYCAQCAPLMEAKRAEYKAQAERAYNRRRSPIYKAFYNSKPWKVTSRARLSAAEYKCEARCPGCNGLAVEVHHIKPIQTEEGWAARLEWDNLEAVCISCHNARHERGKKAVPAGVLDVRAVMREL